MSTTITFRCSVAQKAAYVEAGRARGERDVSDWIRRVLDEEVALAEGFSEVLEAVAMEPGPVARVFERR